MILRRFAVLVAFSSLAIASACGPGPTPETPSGGPDGGSGPGSSSGSTGDAGAPTGTGPAKQSDAEKIAESKKAFMAGCAKGGEGTGDFCECAWGELRAAVGDARIAAEGPTEQDLVQTHPRIMSACKAKMPESAVKQGFLAGCVGERKAEMTAYCDCSWAEFRKVFSAGDLGDESIIRSEKFTQARIAVTKTCGPKISEKVVKEGFMSACARDPKMEKFCGCAWDELKKIATPAEIEAGVIDKDKVTSTIEKGCSKFKPAAK